MKVDNLHQDMYAYDIYSEYLNRIQHYALNSTINSLSIRYYKINMPFVKGVHEDIGAVTTKRLDRVYDIFDFVPVLESQPLTYTNVNDEEAQGVIRKTQGVLTILAIEEPLPYDIFNFYQMQTTNEFFYVTEVNFVHSVKDLNIYQIMFETAPVKMQTVEDFNILNHFYYSKEFNKFFDKRLYDEYVILLEDKDSIMDIINTFYSCTKVKYIEDGISDDQEKLVNSMLLYLNKSVELKINPILNFDILYKPDSTDTEIESAIEITSNDCYYPDPDYTGTNPLNSSDPYDPYRGEIELVLLTNVKKLQDIYYKFIYYRKPEDDKLNNEILDTTQNKNIRDLNGNIIQ